MGRDGRVPWSWLKGVNGCSSNRDPVNFGERLTVEEREMWRGSQKEQVLRSEILRFVFIHLPFESHVGEKLCWAGRVVKFEL